ncbi:hypothetical protein Nepgr_012310 [Nepenthes gracilis]|uniref:Glabrous enhancer-binding protein-like DBD domain-containing protein n=1 Tax=Nepenthes gracilis TaxID=150966 RepID=A0AAD3XN04_NEPGR|nr:hypothetical protein Nepgr_012310 [Nepenthes gracilis]
MASEGDYTAYNDNDLNDDDNKRLDQDDDNVVDDENDDSESDIDDANTNYTCYAIPTIRTVVDSSFVTLALPAPVHSGKLPSPIAVADVTATKIISPAVKRQRVGDPATDKRPVDNSRRLFQRLWTDEDEVELLQGFLDYTTQPGKALSRSPHHTTAFYDQIKSKLHSYFNKNQLFDKLRRLKKKYRNVANRISSRREFVFKSAHDQANFEISRKIWSNSSNMDLQEFFDDDRNHNRNNNSIPNANLKENSGHEAVNMDINMNTPKSRKRSRGIMEEKNPNPKAVNLGEPEGINVASLIQGLMYNVVSGPVFGGEGGGRGIGRIREMALNAIPLNFACMNSGGLSSMADYIGYCYHMIEYQAR